MARKFREGGFFGAKALLLKFDGAPEDRINCKLFA